MKNEFYIQIQVRLQVTYLNKHVSLVLASPFCFEVPIISSCKFLYRCFCTLKIMD